MSKPKRSWSRKIGDALRGIRLGVRGHSSFFVHVPCAILAFALAAILKCDRIEWCLIVGCVGFVLAAELANSAIEALFHALDEHTKGRMIGCLDIAAATSGAVAERTSAPLRWRSSVPVSAAGMNAVGNWKMVPKRASCSPSGATYATTPTR